MLAQRTQAAGHHRHEADGHHQGPPHPDAGERGREPPDQVQPGLDHRRRVQVGAHRGGRHHGAGQPRVERVLRRLGERPHQDQHQADGDRRAAGRVGQDPAELERAAAFDRLADEQEPGEHGQPARAGDEQRLQRGGAGLDRLVVVADEQERRDRGQLPEPEQHDQVVGQDEAQHRAREQDQQAEQAALPGAPGRQVAPGVEEDQHADPRHEQDEQHGEAVESQAHLEPQPGHPGDALAHGVAVEHPARPDRQPRQRRRGGGGRPHHAPATDPRARGDQTEPDDEVGQEQHAHARRPPQSAGATITTSGRTTA